MATYSEGINGPFHGKLGKAVGCTWKGIPYLRALPCRRTGKPGERENLNRKKWALSQKWLQPVTDFVREGFKGYTPTVEGFIAAKSYLLKNAFEGTAPDVYINPALVRVSYGELILPEHITADTVSDQEVQFTWDTSALTANNRRDQVMMLAYNIESNRAQMQLAGEFRKTGSDVLKLYSSKPGTWHLYAAFLANDRSSRSHSVYLGKVETFK